MLGIINTRTEKHGDEEVVAFDIPIDAIMIDADELCALVREPHAHNLFFDTSKTPVEPIFRTLKPQRMAEKIEEANVTIFLGLDRTPVEFFGVKLNRIEWEPKMGGLCSLFLQVQCTPDLSDRVNLTLLSKMGHEIDVEIACDGYGAQAQLPLSEAAPKPKLSQDEQASAAQAAALGKPKRVRKSRAKGQDAAAGEGLH